MNLFFSSGFEVSNINNKYHLNLILIREILKGCDMAKHLFRSFRTAISLCLLITLLGCGAIDYQIEKSIYESTREKGTRTSDVGDFYVHPLSKNSFRLTYTDSSKAYDHSYGIEKNKIDHKIDKKAAQLALDKGYTHFCKSGEGHTAREKIYMKKIIIKCYSEKYALPPDALDARKIIEQDDQM